MAGLLLGDGTWDFTVFTPFSFGGLKLVGDDTRPGLGLLTTTKKLSILPYFWVRAGRWRGGKRQGKVRVLYSWPAGCWLIYWIHMWALGSQAMGSQHMEMIHVSRGGRACHSECILTPCAHVMNNHSVSHRDKWILCLSWKVKRRKHCTVRTASWSCCELSDPFAPALPAEGLLRWTGLSVLLDDHVNLLLPSKTWLYKSVNKNNQPSKLSLLV